MVGDEGVQCASYAQHFAGTILQGHFLDPKKVYLVYSILLTLALQCNIVAMLYLQYTSQFTHMVAGSLYLSL